ncbi:MAG: MBOAT family protein [Bacteroidales bacterium]|jgi:alginate O-acetyltransferase complex protein AlgI|nr:MBOAT family protein [Bacteroidales bacterium]
MLFNSVDFAIFLPIVFVLYWFVTNRNLKLQNALVVLASYFFYGCWDWRFLSLIIFSTVVDYFVGLQLNIKNQSVTKRKFLLWISIIVNIGLLGVFKYYNFFLDNFIATFQFFGITISENSLNIILPVGISFYTFQTLSYSIDVYKRKLEPTKDFIAFAAFVSFFPQLVAGPIERATNLLPQFYKKRKFEYLKATNGLKQILWGLFKKVVIADNCAIYVNDVFNNHDVYSGSTLVIAALLFAFQIYCDFSGYSDIAIGTARLFGFNLMQNFAFPYFSRDIAEFWRRWHISLSTWFRDYLYIPLGGSKGSVLKKMRNVFIIFIVSGFWHGANWTFVIWGGLNAMYFLPLLLMKRNRKNIDIAAKGKQVPNIRESLRILCTFSLTVIAWIFFRADNVNQSFQILGIIFSASVFTLPKKLSLITLLFIIIFILLEWFGRENNYAIESIASKYKPIIRYGFYYALVLSIVFFAGGQQQFIYFQF